MLNCIDKSESHTFYQNLHAYATINYRVLNSLFTVYFSQFFLYSKSSKFKMLSIVYHLSSTVQAKQILYFSLTPGPNYNRVHPR